MIGSIFWGNFQIPHWYCWIPEVYPIISLFCNIPLTKIINLWLSRLPSDCTFSLYTFMNGVTGYLFLGSSIRNFWFLLGFKFTSGLILSKDFWSLLVIWWLLQNSLVLVWNGILLSLALLNTEMSYLIFTATLKTLCKCFPVIFSESSTPFHSLCSCLIRSRIFNLAYIALIFGCTWFPFQMSSRAFVLLY